MTEKNQKKKNLFYKIIFFAVTLFLIITIVVLRSEISDLEAEKEALTSELNDYMDIVEELRYDISLPEARYIEKYAREVLGFHKSGELVFKNNG